MRIVRDAVIARKLGADASDECVVVDQGAPFFEIADLGGHRDDALGLHASLDFVQLDTVRYLQVERTLVLRSTPRRSPSWASMSIVPW